MQENLIENKESKIKEGTGETKICHKCKSEKSLKHFSFKADINKCKECHKGRFNAEYQKQWRLKNHEKAIESGKRYRTRNRQLLRQKSKIYDKTPRRIMLRRKRYKERWRTDINFRMKKLLRDGVYRTLKGEYKAKRTLQFLGCSLDEFKKYIENQFQPGMEWSKFGQFGIHLDHKIPCSAFDLSKPEEQAKCFHYTNFQPLFWSDNIEKSNKLFWEKKENKSESVNDSPLSVEITEN